MLFVSLIVVGSPCIGKLAIENADTTFNSAAGGSDCPDIQAEAGTYAVCEGNS